MHNALLGVVSWCDRAQFLSFVALLYHNMSRDVPKHAFVVADYLFLPHFIIPLTTVTVACEFLYCKI